MIAGYGKVGFDSAAAIGALVAHGFSGRRLFDVRCRTTALHYRRFWYGVSDVVRIFDPRDAEAYRAYDGINDLHPFEIAAPDHLEHQIVGTVDEVVAAVLAWPVPLSRA